MPGTWRALGIAALLALSQATACGDRAAPEPATPPPILSAFFGLDDALPAVVETICPDGSGRDGMPLVVSAPLAGPRLDPGVFRVTKRSGTAGHVQCATLLPAVGPLEQRTILLIGDLGDDPDDPPALVEVLAPLELRDGGAIDRASFADVTALGEGAGIVLAERFAFADVAALVPPSANQCPHDATRQLVNVIWQGGITAAGGAVPGDAERRGLRVTVHGDGGEREVEPFALGDLNDADNHLHLCLDTADRAVAVHVDAGLFFDPGNDANPVSFVPVRPGILPGGMPPAD